MLLNIIQWLPVAYFAVVAIPLAVIDIRSHRLPNVITLPALALTSLCWFLLAVGEGRWLNFIGSLALAVAIFVVGLAINALWGSIGLGDVKLFAGLVLVLSWFIGAWALLLPVVALAGVGVYVFVSAYVRGNKSARSIAFGPYILASAGALMLFAF